FSDSQRERLVDKICGGELDPVEMGRLTDLAAVADGNLCGSLFSRACVIRSDFSSALSDERSRLHAILRQLEEFLRKVSPRVAVTSIVRGLSAELIAHEYQVVIDTFGSIGNDDSDFTTELDDDLRRRFHEYLTGGIRYVLNQNDYDGDLKARVATALARM